MINSYIKIPDNVGTSFEIVNGNIILGNPQSTYVGLAASDVGHYIPYYIKNLLPGDITEWETGIGKVISTTIVERVKVSASSNNNNLVIFSFGGTKTFFVYPNTYSSNLAYNNLISVSGVFSIPEVRSTHLVDLSLTSSSGLLPSASGNRGLIIDFKLQDRAINNSLIIKPSGNELIDGQSSIVLNSDDAYLSIVSDGSNWIELQDNLNTIGLSASGYPQGSNNSIQYKSNATSFGGSNIFYDAQNNGILFGSASVSSADISISSSGNTVFNRNKKNIDFVVNGSGNKNLLYSSTGKLGLNLPSGVQPQTLVHVIGNGCDTNLKLENRNACSVPKITLYHKPSTVLDNNSEISSIHLSAKNSSGSETDYVQLKAFAVSPNSSGPKGSFVLSVNDNNLMLNSLNINPTGILFKTNNKELLLSSQSGVVSDNFVVGSSVLLPFINHSGCILALGSNSSIVDSGYTTEDLLQISEKASISGATFSGNISVPKILSPLSSSNFIDFNSLNISGSWKLNNFSILSADTSTSSNQGRILTHTGSGIVWTVFNEDNFLWSGQDISWKKYTTRDCVIQNNADVLAIPVTGISNEFSVGDTIKIDISGTNYYRIINQVSESNGYTNIVIAIALPTTGPAKVISVSKGGYLDLSVDSSGAPNISPQSIISSRPGFDTIFNNKQHNIGFTVYGVSSTPAMYINPQPVNRSDNTVPITVNSTQPNIINQNNNLNKYASLSVSGYLYTDYIKIGQSPVPSGYILVSASGNIAEWKSTTTINQLDGGVIVFSGVNL